MNQNYDANKFSAFPLKTETHTIAKKIAKENGLRIWKVYDIAIKQFENNGINSLKL